MSVSLVKEGFSELSPQQKKVVTGLAVATPIIVVGGLIGGAWFLGKRLQNSALGKSFNLFLQAAEGTEEVLEKQIQNLMLIIQQGQKTGQTAQDVVDELGLGKNNTPAERARNLQHVEERIVQEAVKRLKDIF